MFLVNKYPLLHRVCIVKFSIFQFFRRLFLVIYFDTLHILQRFFLVSLLHVLYGNNFMDASKNMHSI